MNVSIQEGRPAYVVFETHAEEDRQATLDAGHYVPKDVDYAFITPQGSKDRIPRQVQDWFANLEGEVQSGRLPEAWLASYKAKYKAWKEGSALPESGTPVVNWPAISPGQVKALQAAHLLTLEDLAVANEQAIAQLGMGGRQLKQRAIDWLAAAKDTGKVAEEISALKAQNTDLAENNARLATQLQELSAKFDSLNSGAKRI